MGICQLFAARGVGHLTRSYFSVNNKCGHVAYRTARNFGGQNFGECPRFCVWRLIFWRPAPGSRIAVIEKQILATNILADA